MNLKELADKKIFDKREYWMAFMREADGLAALAGFEAMNAPLNQEEWAQGASYMKRIQKSGETKKRAYDGDAYEIHVHAASDDLNTIVEKAMIEFERMKERRSAAGG